MLVIHKTYACENFPLYSIFGCDFILFFDPTQEKGSSDIQLILGITKNLFAYLLDVA